MIWLPPPSRERQRLLAPNPTADDSSTWNTRLVRDRSRDGDFRIRLWSNPTRQERNTIMELLTATPPRRPTC
jgi:hypothetical protein